MFVWRQTAKALLFNTKLMQVMKKFAIYGKIVLAFLYIIFWSSCQKEEIPLNNISTTKQMFEENKINKNKKELTFDLDVRVVDGLLYFENLTAFQDAMEFLSDNESRFFGTNALNTWENKIGFTSMRQYFEIISNELEQSQDDKTFENDNDTALAVSNEVLASLINVKGKVLIGNALHCFTKYHQIIILDKNEDKLKHALQNLTTIEDKGIFVFNYVYDIGYRGNCGKKRDCTDTEGKKRVSGLWELQLYASPQWSTSCACYSHWEFTIDYYCEMKSEKKGLFGWKKNHNDDINWGTGYGVSSSMGSITHGTGWTQNSWKITYNKRLFPIRTTPFSSPPNPSFQFTYNNTTLNNLDASGLECEDDCF